MKRIESVMFLLLMAPAASAQAPPAGPAPDRIVMTDGAVREGRVLEERPDAVVVEVLLRGSKGETRGVAKMTIPRDRIAKIERAAAADRERLGTRAEGYRDRRRKLAEGAAAVVVDRTEFPGGTGLHAEGAGFDVVSPCPEAMVREATFLLDEMFEAYRRRFRILRESPGKVTVFLFPNRPEYMAFQQRFFGGAVENPAFYIPEKDAVVAYDATQREEAGAVEAEIARLEAEIGDYKKRVDEAKRRVAAEEKRIKEDVDARVEMEKERIRRSGAAGGQALAYRRLDELHDLVQRELTDQRKDLFRELEVQKKEADAAIDNNRRVIARNRGVLRGQRTALYETLYHEAFHAFVQHFLFAAAASPTGPDAERETVPRWLNEGLAMYYERSVVEGDELIHGGVHPAALAVLKAASGKGGLLPLGRVVTAGADTFLVTHPTRAAVSDLAYASSWAVVHHLLSRPEPPDFDGYVAALAKGTPALAAFEGLVGKPLAEYEGAWREYVKSLH